MVVLKLTAPVDKDLTPDVSPQQVMFVKFHLNLQKLIYIYSINIYRDTYAFCLLR